MGREVNIVQSDKLQYKVLSYIYSFHIICPNLKGVTAITIRKKSK